MTDLEKYAITGGVICLIGYILTLLLGCAPISYTPDCERAYNVTCFSKGNCFSTFDCVR